jgi:hypothetical protein
MSSLLERFSPSKLIILFLDCNQILTSMSMNRTVARRADDSAPAATLRVLVDVLERLIPFSEEFRDPKVNHHHSFGHVIESHYEVVGFDVSENFVCFFFNFFKIFVRVQFLILRG